MLTFEINVIFYLAPTMMCKLMKRHGIHLHEWTLLWPSWWPLCSSLTRSSVRSSKFVKFEEFFTYLHTLCSDLWVEKSTSSFSMHYTYPYLPMGPNVTIHSQCLRDLLESTYPLWTIFEPFKRVSSCQLSLIFLLVWLLSHHMSFLVMPSTNL